MNLVYRELAAEHKELMSLIAEAEAFTSADGIQPVLERLHELLIRHFSHEQFPDGLYERMGAHGPKWHPQLRVLVRFSESWHEFRATLAIANRLARRLDSAPAGAVSPA